MLRLLLLAVIVMWAQGCARKSVPLRDDAAPPFIPSKSFPADVPAAYQEIAKKEAELGALRVYAKGLENKADAERLQRLKALSYWVAGFSILAALGCIAAGIYLGMNKTFLSLAMVCGCIAAVSLAFAWVVQYLAIIGVGIGFVVTAAAIVAMRRRGKAAQAAIAYGSSLAAEVDPAKKNEVDSKHRKEQMAEGVYGYIQKMIQRGNDGQR